MKTLTMQACLNLIDEEELNKLIKYIDEVKYPDKEILSVSLLGINYDENFPKAIIRTDYKTKEDEDSLIDYFYFDPVMGIYKTTNLKVNMEIL